ncbi:MAG: substrate-binding domain-containing protein [Chloroflexota bacterium]
MLIGTNRLSIDDASPVPLYAQIEEGIKQAVAQGRLPPGHQMPTVRQLAATIGVHVNAVARVYAELARQGVLSTQLRRGTVVATPSSDRLDREGEAHLSVIIGKALVEALSLGFPLEQMEAAFALRLALWREEAASPTVETARLALPQDALVVMGSHDLSLDILAGELRRLHSISMTSALVGSLAGLIALARGEAHVAGCHLLDEETGEYNVPFVKRLLPGEEILLVNLVYRVQGLMIPRGNPKEVQGLRDLTRPDVTMVNRQRGSGTRVLLDHSLRQEGIPASRIRGYNHEVTTHLGVASAIAGGNADVVLGILAAARALGLDFLPLARERYDLAVPQIHLESTPIQRMLEVIRGEHFRTLVMHNYFGIVGSPDDPAGIKGGKDAVLALERIAQAQALFVSRADDSGTHKMELSLWGKADIEPSGIWYQETGQGMGATLRIASEADFHCLCYPRPDRGPGPWR